MATNRQAPGAREAEDPLVSPGPLRPERSYRHLLVYSVLAVSVVAILPPVLMTGINYHQYQQAFHEESLLPMSRMTANAQLSLESFLAQRLSVLALISREHDLAELSDPARLNRLLKNLKRTFGGFVDLGVIGRDGRQLAYAGPYELGGKDYSQQAWFHELEQADVHVSEVFMGHRHEPHFVIAVQHEDPGGGSGVLRATIDTGVINRQILSIAAQPGGDAFMVNHEGVLQTPSRFYGGVLQRIDLAVPPYSTQAEVMEIRDGQGRDLIAGYAYIDRSPFAVVLLSPAGTTKESWISLRRELVLLLVISVVLVLGVVVAGAAYMVGRLRESDARRAAVLHELQYTNKMAAIGRLAAGVAHEINNPLAIIGEKAGLLKDQVELSSELPPREKIIALVNSVLKSVERCGTITHRLLGFARHMYVQMEPIDLHTLLGEVVGFLEKEASYRSVEVMIDVPEDLPTLESDRGQLQQVFLNIVNNALAAVDRGGRIEIHAERVGPNRLAVSITDNGVGISEEHQKRIFEPFFTTKTSSGTGLGLSITYGIVNKLGGSISVRSKLGEGTCFKVILPIQQNA